MIRWRRLRAGPIAVAMSLFALVLWASLSQPPEAPRVRRALLVSVDGLRPDLILRAKAPSLRSLMERGSFSLWASTTAYANTLPSHTSMLTGVTPARHGIQWNRELPFTRPIYPSRPTLFEVAKNAGYTTAMAVGKPKLAPLAKPGTLDREFVPAKELPDSVVTDTVVRWIAVLRPEVLFVHLGGVDNAGHAYGWGSNEQLDAVATADRCIGHMLGALRSQRLLDSTVILVTADHGGAGKNHGPDDPRSRMIPWIIAGPGIRRNFDLTTDADLNVRTEDSFATLCYLLGISSLRQLDGRAVIQIVTKAGAAR